MKYAESSLTVAATVLWIHFILAEHMKQLRGESQACAIRSREMEMS
jgi:hypothetical protein